MSSSRLSPRVPSPRPQVYWRNKISLNLPHPENGSASILDKLLRPIHTLDASSINQPREEGAPGSTTTGGYRANALSGMSSPTDKTWDAARNGGRDGKTAEQPRGSGLDQARLRYFRLVDAADATPDEGADG